MRLGLVTDGQPDLTGGKVGAYAVGTQQVVAIPGTARIYGTEAEEFRAFQLASTDGRFVVESSGKRVINRSTSKWTKLKPILRRHKLKLETNGHHKRRWPDGPDGGDPATDGPSSRRPVALSWDAGAGYLLPPLVFDLAIPYPEISSCST